MKKSSAKTYFKVCLGLSLLFYGMALISFLTQMGRTEFVIDLCLGSAFLCYATYFQNREDPADE